MSTSFQLPPQARAALPPIPPVRLLPLPCAAAGLLLGQLLAEHVGGVSPALVALGLAAAGLLIRRGYGPLLALAFVTLAWGDIQMDAVLRPRLGPDHIATLAGSDVELRATVVQRPHHARQRTRLLLSVGQVRRGGRWHRATGRVRVTLWESVHEWRRGDHVRARVRLRRPRNFGNPGEFNYVAYLARRGIYVTGFARSDQPWSRRGGHPMRARAMLEDWRADVAGLIHGTLPDPERQILAALVVGATDIDPGVRARYARLGLAHILAVSGLHMGLVALGAFGFWRWLLARSECFLLYANVPKTAVALSAVALLLYSAMAGDRIPALRALIMALLLVVATLSDRRPHWPSALAAAALIAAVLWPGVVHEISFQLSFAAVIAIVSGTRRLSTSLAAPPALAAGVLPARYRLARWVFLYAAVSACAMAGTVPLTALHFNQISLVAPLANPLLLPLLGFVPVCAGLLGALATPWAPPLAGALLRSAGMVVHWGDRIVAAWAGYPGVAVRVFTPSAYEMALFWTACAALLAPRRARRVLLAACTLLALVDAGNAYVARYHHHGLALTFLSVGHGDCTVVRFPGSRVMVIDGGGLSAHFDVGERLVAPFLWRQKIMHVDTLVLTHPDFDHYGGLAFLAREFHPREIWWTGARAPGPRFAAFVAALARAGVRPRVVRRGFHRVIGGVSMLALAPGQVLAGKDNNSSLTLRLRYQGKVVLLPGDMEAAEEARLVRHLRPLLHADVLKIPHHGSRTSSTEPFLDAVRPRVAVLSAGYGRRYGLPNRSVLDRYRRRGVRLRRTDRDGAVRVHINRRSGLVS